MNNSTKYEIVSPFVNGIAIVRKDNLFGAILSGGKELIPPQYQYMSNFIDGYAKTIKNGHTIVLDLSGREYIETSKGLFEIPQDVYDIQECGLNLYRFAIRLLESRYSTPKLKWGVMNEKREILINPEFDYIHEYINNTSKACKITYDGYNTYTEWYIITNKSKIGQETFEIEPAIIAEDELIITRVLSEHSHNYNSNQTDKYFSIRTNSSFVAVVYDDGKRFVLDKNIYRIFPLTYGHYIVQNREGKFGAINRTGMLISPMSCKYKEEVLYPHIVSLPNGREIFLPKDITSISSFEGSFAKFKTAKGMGILDSNGRILVKDIPYYIAKHNSNNTFSLYRSHNNTTWIGLLDYIHNRIIKPNYTRIYSYENDGATVEIIDEGIFNLDKSGRCIIQNDEIKVPLPEEYAAGTAGFNNISIVRKNDLYGLFNVLTNKILTECTYKQISYNDVDIFIGKKISYIEQPKKWGEKQPDIEFIQFDVFSKDGSLLLSDLEHVTPITANRFICLKDGLYGIITDTSEILVAFESTLIQDLGCNRLAITNNDKQTRITDYDGNIITERFISAYSDIVISPYGQNEIAKVQWLDYDGFIDIDGNLVCEYRDSVVQVPEGHDWCFEYNGKTFRCLKSFAEIRLFQNSFIDQHRIGALVKPDGTNVIYKDNKLQEIPSDISGVLCTTIHFSIVAQNSPKDKSDYYDYFYGIINKSGEWILEPNPFLKFGMLSDNIMIIYGRGYPAKQALWNYNKGVITDFRFSSIELSMDNKTFVATIIDETHHKSKKWDEKDRFSVELLDMNFKVMFSMEDARVISQVLDRDQRCLYVIEKVSTHKYGVVNHFGRVIIPFDFLHIHQFDAESFEVGYSYDCKGIFGFDGKIIIPVQYYTIIKNSSDGYIGINQPTSIGLNNFFL